MGGHKKIRSEEGKNQKDPREAEELEKGQFEGVMAWQTKDQTKDFTLFRSEAHGSTQPE